MERRELICIGCPLGCPLSVTIEKDEVIKVEGNTCKKGDTYARKEITAPTRIVTSTVRVCNGTSPMVSVKTESDIPKKKIMDCMQELKDIMIKAPVEIGDVILSNVAETGINVVATKTIKKLD